MGDSITRFSYAAAMALVAVLASSCGTATPTEPTAAGTQTPPGTIMILDGTAVPAQLTIAVGAQVAFMNHDRTTYTIAEERQSSQPGCPEINIGALAAGETRTTEAFTPAKTCDFQVSSGGSTLLTGQIIVR